MSYYTVEMTVNFQIFIKQVVSTCDYANDLLLRDETFTIDELLDLIYFEVYFTTKCDGSWQNYISQLTNNEHRSGRREVETWTKPSATSSTRSGETKLRL
jgi:hypothetical protein